ncbi:MAG: hypothetical protein ACREQ5_24540 [Candidatus Dormibacteria bacterium]
MSAGLSDLVDVVADWVTQTDKAILIAMPDEAFGRRKFWLPKSQCEFERDFAKGSVTVTLPERLALEKGLV